uniref:Transmembrane protein n=1 Tax=Globodera pallida TaxID=36090 RepID=A0A183BPN6_GLOPA
MGRSSIFSLCNIAVCVRRFLFISAVLSLFYLGLSIFVLLPSNWSITSVQSNTKTNFIANNHFNNNKIIKRFGFNDSLVKTVELEESAQSLLETVAHSVSHADESKLCPDIDQNELLQGHLGQATLLIEELEEDDVRIPSIVTSFFMSDHDCDDGVMPCQRKVTFNIPDSYVTAGAVPAKFFDIGTVNMQIIFDHEERSCIN